MPSLAKESSRFCQRKAYAWELAKDSIVVRTQSYQVATLGSADIAFPMEAPVIALHVLSNGHLGLVCVNLLHARIYDDACIAPSSFSTALQKQTADSDKQIARSISVEKYPILVLYSGPFSVELALYTILRAHALCSALAS